MRPPVFTAVLSPRQAFCSRGALLMRSALVFGGSGAIGASLIARLRAAGWHVAALSRETRPLAPGLHWLPGEFAALPALPAHCDAIFSCGPLDLFSHWYADATIACPRVVAFGSTSDATKRDAADPGERELAARLRASSDRVLAAATARHAVATLLRPTLIYGSGRDRNLSRVVQLARRTGFFVLPSNATGLRQPVHVDDLSAAALAAVDAGAAAGRAFALPGGETLTYRAMVARTLAALDPSPRLVVLPSALFGCALAAAQVTGRLRGMPVGAVARMREDLAFDVAPARDAFGYAPRAFVPEAGMFPPA